MSKPFVPVGFEWGKVGLACSVWMLRQEAQTDNYVSWV